jgi:hypothetical protein
MDAKHLDCLFTALVVCLALVAVPEACVRVSMAEAFLTYGIKDTNRRVHEIVDLQFSPQIIHDLNRELPNAR